MNKLILAINTSYRKGIFLSIRLQPIISALMG